MDINKVIARSKAILTTPQTEWPVIAAEPATVGDIYKNHILVLTAIPAVFGFIKSSLIGISIPFAGTFRIGIAAGLEAMVLTYALSLAAVYVIALIIDALAPTFGGQKDRVQAMKAAAYAYTATWIAGVGQIVPWLSLLISLAGGIYSVYLLNVGLPFTMKSPRERSAGYTTVVIIIAFLISLLIGVLVAGVGGTRALLHSGFNSTGTSAVGGTAAGTGASAAGGGAGDDGSGGHFDSDSPMGKLDGWSKQITQAGKKLETAQKSGDGAATGDAMSQMVAATLGGGDKVEPLAPDRIKSFLPDTLAALPRISLSAERNAAVGIQTSEAHATYSDGAAKNLHLDITDMGSAKGLMSLASWAGVEQEQETDHGYQKTYQQAGRMVHEEWNSQSKNGEYAVILAERFAVKISGEAPGIGDLKDAMNALDLKGLEELKTHGVQSGG